MLLVDAHQDLAWNMQTLDRDYTRSATETRRLEQGTLNPSRNGDTLLGWPDYQRGRVALVFATLFAAPVRRKKGDWDTQCYASADEAYDLYSAQLDTYHRLADEHSDKFRLIHNRSDLREVLAHWEVENSDEHPVGLAVLMEGAEAVRDVGELEVWWERGVRIIGPAWAGNRFTGGTNEPGPLTSEGFSLLEGMGDRGFILDISHMDEKAALQALDAYPGTLIASHANAASLLKDDAGNRHLSDRVIQGLVERDGVVGVVPYNQFLYPGWSPSDGRERGTLEHVVAHIDHICQIAGDAHHVGLGSDYDGGFGWQSVPSEIDTIADLQKLPPYLRERGYPETDVQAIMSRNWIERLKTILLES